MAIRALLFAFVAWVAPAFAQTWSTPVYGPGNTSATLGTGQYVTRAVALDAGGNTFVTGSSAGSGTVSFVTTKVTAAGAIAWQKTFTAGAGRAAAAAAVAADSSGNAIVTGPAVNATGTGDVKVIKYAGADGAVLWEKTYDGGRDDSSYAVALDASQNILVAAESINAAGNADIRVLKFSGADGTLLWQRAFDGGREDYVNDIAVDYAGDVIVAGASVNAAGNTDVRVLKISGSSGAIAWQQAYDGGGDDQPYGLALDSGGNATVVGFSMSGGRATALAMKFAGADGRTLWRKNLDAGFGDYAQAVALDASGNAAIAIQSINAAGNFDFRTAKLAAADGAVLWDRRFDSGLDDFAYHVVLDGAGNVVTVGSVTVGAGDTDWKIVRHAAGDGAILDQSGFSGAAGGVDDAFAVASVGNAVVVAGTSHDSGTLQAVRVARYSFGPTAPPPPTLGAPNGTITTLTPMFLWVPSAGATSYTLRVQSGSSVVFTVPLTLVQAGCPANAGACGYTSPTPLTNATSYTWQVSATSANGTSAYSAATAFTTNAPGTASAPAAPAPGAPSGAITSLTPMYLWTPSAGATSYNLRVQTAAGASIVNVTLTLAQASCPTNAGACGYTSATPLASGTSYTWQVSAGNAGGTSALSAANSFSTSGAGAGSPPSAPAPGAPGGTIASLTPMFLWVPSPGATSYTLQVNSSSGVVFSAPLTLAQASCPANSGACGYTPSTPLANNTSFTWVVKASNASGTSANSASTAFSTGAPSAGTAPNPPQLGAPSGASGTLTPFYLWTPSPGATSYTLRVQSGSTVVMSTALTLAQASCPTNAGACGYVPSTPLASGATYTWQVSAANAGGTSAFSAPTSFVTP